MLTGIDVGEIDIKIAEKSSALLKEINSKIYVNHQIDEALDSIAKFIFKEWFIDFGPVMAKGEGKKSFGIDEKAAVLFPDSFEDSELGLIPKGWEIGNIGSIAEHIKRSLEPSELKEKQLLHYSLPNFDIGMNPKWEMSDTIMSNKFQVPIDSILFSKLNPRTPRVWITDHEESVINAIASTEFIVLTAKEKHQKWFLYNLLKEKGLLDFMSQIATGTSNSHQRIRPESLMAYPIILPPVELLKMFSMKVSTMYDQIITNRNESNSLVKMRDVLMPKLISGEINLRD